MTLRNKLLSGAAALGIASVPSLANAGNSATVNATITTDAGITAALVDHIAFGNWLIGIHTGDTPTIALGVNTGNFTTAALGTSQIINLGGATAGTDGQVTVTLPTGADNITLQLQRGAITDFTDSGLSLTQITYDDDSTVPGILAETTPVPIIVEVGGTPEPVFFGATITATATPANVSHTASFTVTFNY